MRVTRFLPLLALPLSLATACFDGDELPPGDGDGDGDGPTVEVAVAGAVIDWATGEPVPGAEVAIDAAFTGSELFPVEREPAAVLAAGEDGRFGPATVELPGDPAAPPVVLFKVQGAGLAPSAADQRAVCGAGSCEGIDLTVPVPSTELANGWRSELAAGGVEDASSRGLVVFEFREPGGAPAAGVTAAQGDEAGDPLEPGTEVRYLAPDGLDLAPAEADSSSEAGVALIALDGELAAVSGRRGDERWDSVGVLFASGWLFLEDRTQR